MKKIIASGNEGAIYASYLFTEVAGIYPITPSSPMPALMDKLAASGETNILGETVKIIEMQSEAGAIGMVHGSLQVGRLTTTYTSSQGLLLMLPNMYKIAGEMLPCTMHVAARTVATHALSIFGDHSDVYSVRGTGFCMLSSANPEDAYYMALISHLSAIKASLPFMHFFDGFRTSHEINKINVLEKEEVEKLIDYNALNKFRQRSFDINNPVTKGTNQNADIYFQTVEARNKTYMKVPSIVNDYMEKINKITNHNYKPFNYYGKSDAEKVIVAMGSVCNTVREYINFTNEKIGLIEVHLFRPFSKEYLLNVLPKTVKKIAVLDRVKEAGSSGEALYLDVMSSLFNKNITVTHGRYGLSSKDTTPGMIKAVYDMLDNPKEEFTIGINDDVTNLSLNYGNIETNNHFSMLIYGYGSDGMVSASKSLIEIIGNNTDNYVQGYFDYDSKKSGGVTVSHLRFSKDKILSSYYVSHPSVVVIANDRYLNEFDAISNIKENGILIISTALSSNELLEALKPYKDILTKKNIKLYSIDAYKLADTENLGRKISMIMAGTILKFIKSVDYNESINYLEKYIDKKFKIKSPEIALANKKALNKVSSYLKEIPLDKNSTSLKFNYHDIYEVLEHRKGNSIKVSEVMNYKDGTFTPKIMSEEAISNYIPSYNSENCITCGQCSFVCPHGVIRPFILDEEEYSKASSSIRDKCVKTHQGYYIISVNHNKCTGCGLCINVCPGKKGNKALSFTQNKPDNEFNYLTENVKVKNFPKTTIKGSQLVPPKFAYSGACAGCGQTAYIKLLTQLFDNVIIANATGCSSIYGGCLPNLPYKLPWSNSLFEDNAEYGFGLLTGINNAKKQISEIMKKYNEPLFEKWLTNSNDYDITKEVYDKLDYEKYPKLLPLKSHIVSESIWAIGGDGWAYDIGFSGIDHVLSSGENINILVLDSQVYSNTGGQASKATPVGAVAEFASSGKNNAKKDLARIAMCYPNVYVAQVCLGANMMQVIKAFTEAYNHNGPSIIIAYTPCISHGIKGGMGESVNIEALATKCGYFPIFRYDGTNFTLDSKNPDFDLYEEFLEKQTRYTMLKSVNEKHANELLNENKENALKRFKYYQSLENAE